MSENSITGIMDVTLEKIRTMVDAQTIIGNPIVMNDISIIPVSKVSFGLATGGSDFPAKAAGQTLFGGGGGAGVSIAPVAFLVINGNDVKMLQIYKDASTADKAISLLPELFDKVSSMFKKGNKKGTVVNVKEQ